MFILRHPVNCLQLSSASKFEFLAYGRVVSGRGDCVVVTLALALSRYLNTTLYCSVENTHVQVMVVVVSVMKGDSATNL